MLGPVLPDPDLPRAAEVDLTDRSLYRDGVPYDLFAALRETGPIHRHHARAIGSPERSFWSVVGHREIHAASRDTATFAAADGPGLLADPMYREMGLMVALDGADHQRLRSLISSGFTPRMIARLEENIARRAELILDALAPAGSGAVEVDFVADIAFPLPMHVIADIVGIPEEDRAWVFAQADRLLVAADPGMGISEEEYTSVMLATYDYAHELSERKRREPTDDVWSLLAQAEAATQTGEEGSLVTGLSGAELDAFFMILTIAGSETTRNALSQGLLELVRHPEQMAALRADPALLPAAAEEVLRWSSPVLMFGRTATCDTELGGAAIAAGDRVVFWYPAANRDPNAFERPDAFDITRTPNPHVAFGGGGAHFCLGANLARREIQVLLGALVRRFAAIEVIGEPQWRGAGPVHNVGVSLEGLQVRLTPSPASLRSRSTATGD